MKSTIVFFVLLFVLACNKQEENQQMPELNGSWELRKAEYGESPEPVVLYSPGNGNLVSFSNDNRYNSTDITNEDTVSASGSYKINPATACHNQAVSVISFSNDYKNNGYIVKLSGDTLYFYTDTCAVADGAKRSYVRVQ